MKTSTQSLSIALLGMSLAIPLTACDSSAEPNGSATPIQVVTRAAPRCNDCGTISSFQQRTDEAKGSGVGMVLGAIAGAVAGHQVGDGRGKDAATVGGAVVGGYAGNKIEKHVKGTPYFHVTVEMDHGGGTRTINIGSMNGLTNGSRVKIVGNDLQSIS